MSDDNKDLSLGEQGQPIPAASDDRSPIDPTLVEALRGVISEEVDRRVKSVKDRRFDALENTHKEVTELRDALMRFNELRLKGYSEEDAIHRMEVESLLAKNRSEAVKSITPQVAQGSAPRQAGALSQEDILEALGLSSNDPEVSAALREGSDSERLTLIALKQKRAAKQAPSPAAMMPSGSGVGVATTTADALQAEYNQRISKIRRGDAEAAWQIKKDIRRKAQEADIPSPV